MVGDAGIFDDKNAIQSVKPPSQPNTGRKGSSEQNPAKPRNQCDLGVSWLRCFFWSGSSFPVCFRFKTWRTAWERVGTSTHSCGGSGTSAPPPRPGWGRLGDAAAASDSRDVTRQDSKPVKGHVSRHERQEPRHAKPGTNRDLHGTSL